MSSSYNPDDYGPGKRVTAEQAEAFFHANAHKIVMMLMARLGTDDLLLGREDVEALMRRSQGSALSTHMGNDGIRLSILGPGAAAALFRRT